MYYSGHRNASVPAHYTKDMAIIDTAVHDFDVVRWLLGEEIAAIRVLAAKPNSLGGDLQDPLLMILESESGVLVNVETSVNIRYGYDIRGEVVGETGTAALADRGLVVVRSANRVASRVPEDWRERFIAAYDVEFQEWINAVRRPGAAAGPSAWDGYAARSSATPAWTRSTAATGSRSTRCQARALQLTAPHTDEPLVGHGEGVS